MNKKPFFQSVAVILWLTGPFITFYISKSVNEQPAIWCLYSVIQVIVFVAVVRIQKLHLCTPPSRLIFPGGKGEETLIYTRQLPEAEKRLLDVDFDAEEAKSM